MKHCATCKYWTPSEEWDVKAGGLRNCEAVRPKWIVEDELPRNIFNKRYEWDTDDFNNEYSKAAELVFSKAKAVVNDGSQYVAELLTRPEFGCVLHEEKE